MKYEKPTVEVQDFSAQEKIADMGLTRDVTDTPNVSGGVGPIPTSGS